MLSLKVLQELSPLMALPCRIHQQNADHYPEVAEFVPLIMETITLQPSEERRLSLDFNKEVFHAFLGAQINTLSHWAAHLIKTFMVTNLSVLLIK